MTDPQPDGAEAVGPPEDVREFVRHVYGFMEGAVVAGMIHLGDRLGLYEAMAGAGPLTADELAERTGLHPRWVLEWLRGQAGAGILAYDDGRFELTSTGELVLADELGSPAYAAGAFRGLPDQMRVLERLPDAFRTGIGLPFDALGRGGNEGVAQMFAPWYRHALVPLVLPALDGVVDRLEAGGKAAELGCGAGYALQAMAEAFPRSAFHGFDLSRHALDLAGERTASLENVTLHHAAAQTIPSDASFDLVCTFDCIHDMSDPLAAMRAVRSAIRDDGVFLIGDIKSAPTFDENLERNPVVAMMYGFSVLSCLSSSMSEPDGAGLGTLGFHEDRAREFADGSGFSVVRVHDFEHPVQIYYELRP